MELREEYEYEKLNGDFGFFKFRGQVVSSRGKMIDVSLKLPFLPSLYFSSSF